MENAVARIAWLEDIIRSQLPHVNLENGPLPTPGSLGGASMHCWSDTEQISTPRFLDELSLQSSTAVLPYPIATTQMGTAYGQSINPSSPFQNSGSKRPLSSVHAQPTRESSVEEDTRSVALGLGFLSLNSDSPSIALFRFLLQVFARLVGANRRAYNNEVDGPSARPHQLGPDDNGGTERQNPTGVDLVRFDVLKSAVNDLYALLRKVS